MKAAESAAKFFGHLLASVFISMLAAMVSGWLLMLAVGVAHHEWTPDLPTIGYWWAVLLAWLLRSATLTASSMDGDR